MLIQLFISLITENTHHCNTIYPFVTLICSYIGHELGYVICQKYITKYQWTGELKSFMLAFVIRISGFMKKGQGELW